METQQTDQQTGQQATNAALAALAAAGNAFALGQLWEINQGFVRQQLRRWYDQNRPVADAAGLGFDDLVQEGYFAVDYAAKHYNAKQGSFTTYLSYALLKQIRATTCGEHTRSIPTEDGRRVLVSANPLNSCSSLDLPLDGEDEGSSTRGETIPDPAAAQEFQRAEDSIYTDELHTALEEALSKLATRQADVLRRRYYDEKSLRSVGEEIGLTSRAGAPGREHSIPQAAQRSRFEPLAGGYHIPPGLSGYRVQRLGQHRQRRGANLGGAGTPGPGLTRRGVQPGAQPGYSVNQGCGVAPPALQISPAPWDFRNFWNP